MVGEVLGFLAMLIMTITAAVLVIAGLIVLFVGPGTPHVANMPAPTAPVGPVTVNNGAVYAIGLGIAVPGAAVLALMLGAWGHMARLRRSGA
jgi:hypothetical protein